MIISRSEHWNRCAANCILSPVFTASCVVEAFGGNKIKVGSEGGANTWQGVWPLAWSRCRSAALWSPQPPRVGCVLMRRRSIRVFFSPRVESSSSFGTLRCLMSPDLRFSVRRRRTLIQSSSLSPATGGFFYAAHVEPRLSLQAHALKTPLIAKHRLEVRPGN